MSLPASYIVNQRWPYYRSLPPSLKAFGVVMAVVPAFVIAGETAGRRYEQNNWQVTPGFLRDQKFTYFYRTVWDRERANPDQVALIHRRSETRWENMTLGQKAVDFTARHQFSVIAGCWALGIAGAFGTIMRNPCVCNNNR